MNKLRQAGKAVVRWWYRDMCRRCGECDPSTTISPSRGICTECLRALAWSLMDTLTMLQRARHESQVEGLRCMADLTHQARTIVEHHRRRQPPVS